MKAFFQRLHAIWRKIQQGRLKELFVQWRWMGGYIRRYGLLIALYTLLGSVGALLGLATSIVTRNLIDAVTGYNSHDILQVAALYIGTGTSQIFINVIKSRFLLRIHLKISNEIRTDIFRQILQTEWEALSAYRAGDLLYRMNGDTGMVANHILTFFPNLLSMLITLIGAFSVVVQSDPVMALIALCGAPVSLIVSRYSMAKMRDHQKKNQEFASSKLSFSQEAFQNLQMIKAFNLVDTFTEKFQKTQEEGVRISMDQNKCQSIGNILTSLVGQAIGYACYGFAVYRLWQGEISYGTMTLFVSMSSALRGSFQSAINLLPVFVRAGISAGRIMEILRLPREPVAESPKIRRMQAQSRKTGVKLRMVGVGFRYGDGKPVYADANFYALPGEIIGLIGPSGQGKTTTLRLLLGLFHPQKGQITVAVPGETPEPVSSATRCFFSYIPQGNTLFSGSVAENLRLFKPDATDQELIRVLESACAWEFIRELPEGLDTDVQENGTRFSEGQKQRLSIARALLADAPVLLLDEATSALDMETEARVLQKIVRREPHRTLLVAAHRPTVFTMCTRVYRIAEGKMTECSAEEHSTASFVE